MLRSASRRSIIGYNSKPSLSRSVSNSTFSVHTPASTSNPKSKPKRSKFQGWTGRNVSPSSKTSTKVVERKEHPLIYDLRKTFAANSLAEATSLSYQLDRIHPPNSQDLDPSLQNDLGPLEFRKVLQMFEKRFKRAKEGEPVQLGESLKTNFECWFDRVLRYVREGKKAEKGAREEAAMLLGWCKVKVLYQDQLVKKGRNHLTEVIEIIGKWLVGVEIENVSLKRWKRGASTTLLKILAV